MSELWQQFSYFMSHLPEALADFSRAHGVLVYGLLAAIVFCETGLVVTPFLPGDSLLFACGMLAWRGKLSIPVLAGVFIVAALLGDNVNYWLGRALGPRILRGESVPLLNRKNLDKTHAFFERHGGKSVVMARFVPIVRTFAPFTAGVGRMDYARFLAFSVLGAVLWVGVCMAAGYWLGRVEAVRNHFDLAIVIIIFVSLIPMAIGLLRARRESKQRAGVAPASGSAGSNSKARNAA